jgi:hypothetical protein
MFQDQTDFEGEFDGEQGPVQLFADCHIIGRHLILDELLVYPKSAEKKLTLTLKEVFGVFLMLRTAAAEEGFEHLTVTYHRVGPRRTGHIMTFTRTLP